MLLHVPLLRCQYQQTGPHASSSLLTLCALSSAVAVVLTSYKVHCVVLFLFFSVKGVDLASA